MIAHRGHYRHIPQPGLLVAAEGVETREHCDPLAPYSKLTAQGYYFAKPVPAEEIPQAIAAIAMRRLSSRSQPDAP